MPPRFADRALPCQVSLAAGAGARRLAEARCRAAVQLLLVQAGGEVYVAHAPRLPQVPDLHPNLGHPLRMPCQSMPTSPHTLWNWLSHSLQ